MTGAAEGAGPEQADGSHAGGAGFALALGIAAGLTLAGSSLAAWVREVRVDDVAGVPIEAVEPTTGVELVPVLLPLGIAAAGLALALGLPLAGLRRALGAVLILTGGLATVFAGRGAVLALRLESGLETGAHAAVLAAVGIAVAGLVAIRPARETPRLSSRYDLEGGEDDEWELASAEVDEDGEPDR